MKARLLAIAVALIAPPRDFGGVESGWFEIRRFELLGVRHAI